MLLLMPLALVVIEDGLEGCRGPVMLFSPGTLLAGLARFAGLAFLGRGLAAFLGF